MPIDVARPRCRARLRGALGAALLLGASVAAHAQATRFDGAWQVTMTCPPHTGADDDAKGYTHHFPGQVVDGQLTAIYGTEGEPGWHYLRGPIQPGGEASLRLDGIVNNTRYAINEAPRGKPYSYRVKAQFDEARGTGQRVTGRVCDFQFTR